MNNPQDLAQLLASAGGNPLLGGLGGINPLTGLPNAGPVANGAGTAGADALFQSLLQRHAMEKFAALNGLNSLPQGSLQMLIQQKQLQDLQTLTLARSMGMGSMFNPMMGGGGGFDALALLQQQQQQVANAQDLSAAVAASAQEAAMYPLPPDRRRKGRTGTFPQKLHQLLSDLERQEGGALIASFLPHGRAFAIHKPRDFVKHVMPKYFRMSRFSSFQRQLNLYEMERITEGPDKGAYFHSLFIQGRPILSTMMKRVKIKGVKTLQDVNTHAAAALMAAESAVAEASKANQVEGDKEADYHSAIEEEEDDDDEHSDEDAATEV
ncbi:hypothetical protein MPSEU_000626300 [Mayamaea pseudoterrestris]|nr:hypothetical protein MPSEU_000626300 [Mayamaea pseudoterrestris]